MMQLEQEQRHPYRFAYPVCFGQLIRQVLVNQPPLVCRLYRLLHRELLV